MGVDGALKIFPMLFLWKTFICGAIKIVPLDLVDIVYILNLGANPVI